MLDRRRNKLRLVAAIAGAIGLALGSASAARADDLAIGASAACQSLQAKYPGWKGKTLVDAINPHTPGYEALDPADPSHYIGFDINLYLADSLSSRHQTADLQALHTAALAHLAVDGMDDTARAALAALAGELRQRFLLRDFLDRRAEAGRAGALLSACRYPMTLAPIVRGILADKLSARRPPPASRIGRLLIE